jgi:pimeloyl-ACP methyl ester carboxylesterase
MMDKQVVWIGATPIEIRTTGTGPPVLFIHGLYVNEHLWDSVADSVSAFRTCYLPTLPLGAHNVPVKTNWSPTLDELASLIPELIQDLDLHDVTVVANDTGGGLVLLALGSSHPALGRVSRVVLTNCDSYGHLPPTLFGPLVAVAHYAPLIARPIMQALLATSCGKRAFLRTVVAREPDAQMYSLFNPKFLDDVVAVTGAIRPTARQREMAWLKTLDIPLDLVWGDNDVFFPAADAERIHRDVPNSTITWIPGGRTFVSLDDPDTIAAVVLDRRDANSA